MNEPTARPNTSEPAPDELEVEKPAAQGPPAPAKPRRTKPKPTAAKTTKTTRAKRNMNTITNDITKSRTPSRRATGPKVPSPRTPAPRAASRGSTAPRGRPSLSPRERAQRPVTSTIAAYVEWLNRTVFDGKLTGPQLRAAGIAITLYGQYQVSDERRRDRSEGK